jgi:hypothetical protein
MRLAIKFGMSISYFYDSTPRELYNFIRAKREALEERQEQELDYMRHVMWSSMVMHTTTKIKPDQILRLKRDGKQIELTPYLKQEVSKWEQEMDKEMGIL